MLLLLILEYFYLTYIHRGEILRIIDRYVNIHNKNLNIILEFTSNIINILRLPPVSKY